MKTFMFLNQPLESTLDGYRGTEQRAAARSARHRTIERASHLARGHLTDALQDGRPVIYSGLISQDELLAWTPANLMSTYASVVTELGMRVPMGRLHALRPHRRESRAPTSTRVWKSPMAKSR